MSNIHPPIPTLLRSAISNMVVHMDEYTYAFTTHFQHIGLSVSVRCASLVLFKYVLVWLREYLYMRVLCMWIAYAKGKKSNENTLKKSKSDVFTYYGMCTICDKKNWEMGRRGDSGNTTAIATALTHDEKKNSEMWEPIFRRGFFRLPPFYMFIYCSVFVPFPIMIWNENREENQCQCFYSSAFHCCAYPIYIVMRILSCVRSVSLCVCVARSLFLPTLSPPIHLSIGEISRTTHLQSIVRLNLYI